MLGEVTRDQLADWFGLSPVNVTLLARDGILPKAARGRYNAVDCIRAYCAHLRAGASGRMLPGAVSDERARLLAAQADGHELRNAATRGELVDARQVEAEWSNTLRSLRAAMIAVPSRVRQRLPGLSPAEVAAIDAEIRRALTESANDV